MDLSGTAARTLYLRQFAERLIDGLILTVDPTYQYTLANGGSQTALIAENSYLLQQAPTNTGGVDLKLNGAYEFMRFDFSDFTDLRTAQPYSHDATVFQVSVAMNF